MCSHPGIAYCCADKDSQDRLRLSVELQLVNLTMPYFEFVLGAASWQWLAAYKLYIQTGSDHATFHTQRRRGFYCVKEQFIYSGPCISDYYFIGLFHTRIAICFVDAINRRFVVTDYKVTNSDDEKEAQVWQKLTIPIQFFNCSSFFGGQCKPVCSPYILCWCNNLNWYCLIRQLKHTGRQHICTRGRVGVRSPTGKAPERLVGMIPHRQAGVSMPACLGDHGSTPVGEGVP